MDDYYIKYAKPVNPFSYENLLSELTNWNENLKEELEIIIFISSTIADDKLNRISNADKTKNKTTLEAMKKDTLFVMEKVNEMLFDLKGTNHLLEETFGEVELIREKYNEVILKNTKSYLNNQSLQKIKSKYSYGGKKRKITNANATINLKSETQTTGGPQTGYSRGEMYFPSNSFSVNQSQRGSPSVSPYKSLCKIGEQKNENNFTSTNFNTSISNLVTTKSSRGSGLPKSRSFVSKKSGPKSALSTIKSSYREIDLNNDYKSELEKVKEDINSLKSTVELLTSKVTDLQKENNSLKQHNLNLLKFIQEKLSK